MTVRNNLLIIAALSTGIAASILNFSQVEAFDVGETSYGALTGPMIILSFLGSALLLVGAMTQIWQRRLGSHISLAGLALMLPLFSWFFAAGLWCLDGKCYGQYPLFSFNGFSALTLVLACTSIALIWRPRLP